MRLYQDEKTALEQSLLGVDDEVYLFGSRADDAKKGGDIDILIFSKKNAGKLAESISMKFLMLLDSKLDVIVFDKDNMTIEQTAFVNTLNLIKLK
ncbi:MAG: nucleotidyltransferase domain-containing protein [Methylococcales symbiont of Hymedesmia sp. n. MRB-2018]|nr:MAG: nucleotidyltransferase domain-containing protein [Methylococcales symbiont of Hymedesmia sp. n. MRB-2018]